VIIFLHLIRLNCSVICLDIPLNNKSINKWINHQPLWFFIPLIEFSLPISVWCRQIQQKSPLNTVTENYSLNNVDLILSMRRYVICPTNQPKIESLFESIPMTNWESFNVSSHPLLKTIGTKTLMTSHKRNPIKKPTFFQWFTIKSIHVISHLPPQTDAKVRPNNRNTPNLDTLRQTFPPSFHSAMSAHPNPFSPTSPSRFSRYSHPSTTGRFVSSRSNWPKVPMVHHCPLSSFRVWTARHGWVPLPESDARPQFQHGDRFPPQFRLNFWMLRLRVWNKTK
jgi:hypothetical protein